ncbi:MAG: thiamine pyrophosphate-binding protein [bacterium]|nr:thiamine pyrophosphate-binding protein [bacterium]
MKISDYLTKFLKEKKITYIFGYIGGMITHLTDSIDKEDGIDYIQVYHEQTASIAAEGYALIKNIPGVAISTSGPGATNMITGIADAYFGSIPTIYITGQVNTYEYKWDKPIRQQGFQETDIVSMVKSITKYSKLISDKNSFIYELEKAYSLAISGRKGPVLLDIPMNIQRSYIEPEQCNHYIESTSNITSSNHYNINDIYQLIIEAKKPIFLVGGGCREYSTKNILYNFLKKTNFPLVYSLMGKGIIHDDFDHNYGFIGSYGLRSSNIALANSDLIIALGTRLDVRQTGSKLDDFISNNKKIIHVNIDLNELEHHRLDNRINVFDTVCNFLDQLNFLIDKKLTINNEWVKFLNQIKYKYNQIKEIERFVTNPTPYNLIHTVNNYSKNIDIITVDIGQNQMWAAQGLKMDKHQSFYTSGGLAPMGFAIPSAIGASFANPQKKIISINGDGGFHISTQSLMLITQYNLPVKVIVINNKSLGMITQFQELYFNNRLTGTVHSKGYAVPNIEEIAKAYSLPYFRLNNSDLSNAKLMDTIFKNTHNCIVEFLTDKNTTVSPKVEYDSSIDNPTPKLPIEEYNSTIYHDK